MYLGKAAYIAKTDREPEYTKMISDLDARNASKAEQVQAMRSVLGEAAGCY